MYDVIIIGGGPAGLTASIYTSRAKLKTLILEKMIPGGQVTTTHLVENYPGFPEPINGFLLMSHFQKQAQNFGAEIVISKEVTSIEKEDKIFKIKTPDNEYKAKAVLIATGAKYKTLGIPGEEKFKGRGVSYCATCDGAFFKDKEVAVIGGGNSALEEALFLTKFVKKVYLIHRRFQFRADKILQDRVKENEKIEPILNYVPVSVNGTDEVESITIEERDTKERKEIKVDGVFFFIGLSPNSEFLKDFVKKDENGYIIVNENLETNVEGCFAAGDVIKKKVRQIATAVGDGATAGVNIREYLENL